MAFIPLSPSKTGRASQGLKVAGAGAGHHHSMGKVQEDGEGACALPSYFAFPEVKDTSYKLQKCNRSVKTPRGQLHRLGDRLCSFYVSLGNLLLPQGLWQINCRDIHNTSPLMVATPPLKRDCSSSHPESEVLPNLGVGLGLAD